MTKPRGLALVTGGAGLIGSFVVDALLTEGFRVRILDSLARPAHAGGPPSWLPREAEFWCGDVTDPVLLSEAMDGVDYIFHQAAHGGFVPGAAPYIRTNTVVAALMFDILTGRAGVSARPRKVRKIVFASTQAVYGEGHYRCPAHGNVYPPPRSVERLAAGRWEPVCPVCGGSITSRPVSEDHIHPYTPYAISKAAAETIFLRLGETNGIPTTGLRYALTFGPRQSLTNPYTGITSIFTTRLKAGRPIVIYEDGNQTRDFIFVTDVAKANLVVALDERADGQVYNVGTGRATTIAHFASLLATALGVPCRTELTGEFRPGEVRHLVTDGSRLEALGWRPETSLLAGLGRYAEWVDTQPPPRDVLGEVLPDLRRTGVVRKTEAR